MTPVTSANRGSTIQTGRNLKTVEAREAMSSPPRPMGALRTHVEGMPPTTPQSSLKGAGVVDDKENNVAPAPPNVSATPQSVRTTAA